MPWPLPESAARTLADGDQRDLGCAHYRGGTHGGESAGIAPPAVRGWAQIDTGADVSCIAQDVVDELAMRSVGVLTAVGAGGHEMRSGVYAVRVKLFSIDPYRPQILPFWSGPVVPMAALDLREERHGLQAVVPTEIEAPTRSIALLGRDFLREFQFTYSGPGSYFTLAY